MEFQFLPRQNYDCVQCAKGCQAPWRIHVDPYSQRQLAGTALELRVIQETGSPPTVVDDTGATIVSRRPDGRCVFLGEDKLCQVHGELGIDAKPIGCRQFPFMIRPTPDGIVVGVSFFCTSVQHNSGRPLEAHAQEIREIMKGIRFKLVGDEPIPVWGQATMEWPAYKALEELLYEAIAKHGFQAGLGQLIWALCQILIGDRAITAEALREAVRHAPPGTLEKDLVIVSQNEFLTAAVVAMLESPAPEKTRSITEALLEGQLVALPRFAWEGLAKELEVRRETSEIEALNPQVERYLKALVHRKFLMVERPLLANLAVLYLVPRVLRTYTALSSLSRQAPQAEVADFYRALEVVEVGLVTHAKGLDRIYEALAESFYNQIAALA